jgi:hypothetical protein
MFRSLHRLVSICLRFRVAQQIPHRGFAPVRNDRGSFDSWEAF